jgi:hypothetical protein
VTVPSVVAPYIIVTVAPASAVPVIVGLSLEVEAIVPIVGVVDIVSIFRVATDEALLTFPALSVAFALSVYVPSLSEVVGVYEYAPVVASAVTVAIRVAPLYICTLLPASADPDMVGVLLLV